MTLAGPVIVRLWPYRESTLKGGFQWRQRSPTLSSNSSLR